MFLFKYLLCLLALAMFSSYGDVSVAADDKGEFTAVKVGLVSSLNQTWGRMSHHFVKMAISDFYRLHPNYTTRLLLQARDSQNDIITSAAVVEDLIKKEQAIAIIGPETSQEAQFDISLGERSKVPLITSSASIPILSSPYFIQATQDDSSQVEAITSIIQAFGWKDVVPVYVNNQFGSGIFPFLVDALQQINTMVPYRCVISSSATDEQIKEELSILKGRQTRVFVVHMDESLASRVFSLATILDMMASEYVWIVTSSIANTLGSLGPEIIQSMQGVLGVKTYVPRSKEMIQSFKNRWGGVYQEANDLDIWNLQLSLYGLWAYDATFLLAEAVEQVHSSNFSFLEVKRSPSDACDLSAFAVSDVGPHLVQWLQNTSFRGMSGNFSLVNGKLQTSTFEIVNVIGTRENNVGFWTLEKGIVRNLDGVSRNFSYSTSKDNLGPITWPGDSTAIPKGWVINGMILRILVPVKEGFTEFVNASVNHPHLTTGFCIDVFNAVVKTLGYDLPYEFIPFVASYNDMITQVYRKNVDAVVGDVTILSNRSLYVDYTAPYMEADVLMVVPGITDSRANKVWAFLRPLSWKLWITTLCFFVLIAFVIWFNEYEINDEFRAESRRSQIGLCLFFSFSTMVFSHKESPKSNLSRLVMVCWLFTLLLLTQSYTANLASTLTVEQLHFSDINELVRTGKKVGCQGGTFMRDFLRKLNFDGSNIIFYETEEKLHDLLSKGSDGGGIDAAFDEAPYMNLFLSKYCSHSHYMSTVVPPLSRTDGLAFVFSKGSPLVADFSRGLLELRETETMTALWNKWMNVSEDCSKGASSTTSQPSAALDLDSFLALFAITGGASLAAVALKLAFFYPKKRPKCNPDFTLTKVDVITYDDCFKLSTSASSPASDDRWGANWLHLAS